MIFCRGLKRIGTLIVPIDVDCISDLRRLSAFFTVRLDKVSLGTTVLPAWIPSYPGAKSSGNLDFAKDEGEGGTWTFETKDKPEAVASFYENILKKEGYEIEKNTTQIPGQGTMVILSATNNELKRTVQVHSMSKDSGSAVTLAYESK